jgi:TIR domain
MTLCRGRASGFSVTHDHLNLVDQVCQLIPIMLDNGSVHSLPISSSPMRKHMNNFQWIRDRINEDGVDNVMELISHLHPAPSQLNGKTFDVFLSHNSSDKPGVRSIAEDLTLRGMSVWLDEWELVPGRPWQDDVERVIGVAGAAAVLIGNDGVGPWLNGEMRGCLAEFVDRKLPVIPVLLPGAPKKPDLPVFLRQFTWVDLRSGVTPKGLDRLQRGITGRNPSRR